MIGSLAAFISARLRAAVEERPFQGRVSRVELDWALAPVFIDRDRHCTRTGFNPTGTTPPETVCTAPRYISPRRISSRRLIPRGTSRIAVLPHIPQNLERRPARSTSCACVNRTICSTSVQRRSHQPVRHRVIRQPRNRPLQRPLILHPTCTTPKAVSADYSPTRAGCTR